MKKFAAALTLVLAISVTQAFAHCGSCGSGYSHSHAGKANMPSGDIVDVAVAAGSLLTSDPEYVSFLNRKSFLFRDRPLQNDKKEIERRMTHFEQVCRGAGVKLTHQRMEIFRQVAQSGHHPDAEIVFRGVRKRVPTISLDTVYRTLWLLSDLGLITTLGPGRERARFDANLRRHHHFMCRRCGLISDFYSDALDELKLPEAVTALGFVETTHVEVEGLCRECGSQEESTTTKWKGRRAT